jgi:glycosyltransferase involved in cell wall biosynthesis
VRTKSECYINSPKILLVFSDVNASAQLLAILERLRFYNASFKVHLIGDQTLQIAQDMSKSSIEFILLTPKNKYSSLTLFWEVWVEIVRNRPKVIYASGQFASAVGISCGFFAGIKLRVFTRHHSDYHHKYNMKFGIFVDKLTNMFANRIIAVSRNVQEIITNLESVSQKKVTLIPNGIDLLKFTSVRPRRDEHRLPLRQDSSSFHIGIVSRMTNWKGIEYTAQAFCQFQRQHPNAHLTIIGAFSDSYEKISDILKVLPKESYSLEKFRPDIPKFLSELDVLVHVPIGFHDEAFGIIYIEALAAGVPCIVTISGVLHELPDLNNYAEVVPYKDSQSILAAMLKVANHPDEKKSYVPDLWLQGYSLAQMAERYSELLLGKEIR